MFKHFIWDFDGTLYDTYPIMLDAIIQTLEDNQIQADRKTIYRLLKAESSAAVAATYRLDFATFSKQFQRYERQDERIPLSYKGTAEMLNQLTAAGAKHYILTHRNKQSTTDLLEKEKLLNVFDDIISSDSPFPRKPDPASLQYLIDKHQMNPEKTVMIGDRALDIIAGKNAGVPTIFYDLEQLLTNIPADYTVNSVSEMLDFI